MSHITYVCRISNAATETHPSLWPIPSLAVRHCAIIVWRFLVLCTRASNEVSDQDGRVRTAKKENRKKKEKKGKT